jgi:hypothetical protein
MHGVTIAAAALVAAGSLASTSDVTDPIVVTRDAQALPAGCAPRETALLLARFADAVSAGDLDALDRLFAVEDPPGRALEPAGTVFRWYSVTEGRAGAPRPWRHVAFYDRTDLFPYFAERHRLNERWELVSVAVTPSRTRGAAGITYTIRRTADDLPPWLNAFGSGKGGVDCTAGRIFLWSWGQNDTSVDVGSTCPRPRAWSAGAAIFACTQGPNARPTSTGFRLRSGPARLPEHCAPERSLGTLRSTLSTFNTGLGEAFVKRFARNALLTSGGTELRSRRKIESFVHARYSAGEGWTARALRAPERLGRSGSRRTGVYRLALLVIRPTENPVAARAEVTLDCESGLIRRWRGPIATR